jgi:enolase-phosphatase E1
MQSFIVVREGNAPLSEEVKEEHGVVASFEEVRIRGAGK